MSMSQSAAQELAESADEVTQVSRRGKKRSPAWNHFEELPHEGKVKCIHCNTKLAYHQGIGVSHLKNHIVSVCKEFPEDIDRSSIFTKNVSSVDGRSFVVDPKLVRDFMTKFWISANIAFKKIENRFFKKMMKSAHPSLEVHGRQTLRDDCVSVYADEKKKISNGFDNTDSRVSFTADMWTSCQNLGYICLTAHYIDGEFNLHSHTINFKQVPHPHNAAAIHSTIMDCLYEWDLTNKAFAFTLDNATSNDKAVRKLKAAIWTHMPFEGGDLHVRCAAHILNLIVQDGMQTIQNVIEPLRDVIKHIASSGSRLQIFNTLPHQFGLQPKRGFSLDVSTRWNSTYEMLEEALQYKDPLSRYVDLQNIKGPSEEQWNLARRICTFLKNFADATKVFSMHNFPTAHRYVKEVWGIRELLLDEKNQSDEFLKLLCDDMKSKFDKYWHERPNKILLIASLLDPRNKFRLLRFCFVKAYGMKVGDVKANEALSWFKEYYAHYDGMLQRSSQNNISSSPEVGGSASMLPLLTGKRKLELEFALFNQQSRTSRSRSELDKYLEDPLAPTRENDDFDVLRWWKRNEDQYPVLAKMARDFLAIPLSTVASESTFSTAGMVIDKHRNSLSPKTVEALICSKDWLRQYLSDDDDGGVED